MAPCSEIRHIVQQTSAGWESVIFSGPISNATIYQRKITTALDPIPVAQLAAQNGWCEHQPQVLNLDAMQVQPARNYEPRSPLAGVAQFADLLVALVLLSALMAGFRWVSLRWSPPPGEEINTPVKQPFDKGAGEQSNGQTPVRQDSGTPIDKPINSSPVADEGDIDEEEEWFDFTGWKLVDFKREFCPTPLKIDVSVILSDPATAAAHLNNYCNQFGPQRPDFALWQVFGLSRRGGDSPYAQKADMALQFVKQCLENYQPADFDLF